MRLSHTHGESRLPFDLVRARARARARVGARARARARVGATARARVGARVTATARARGRCADPPAVGPLPRRGRSVRRTRASSAGAPPPAPPLRRHPPAALPLRWERWRATERKRGRAAERRGRSGRRTRAWSGAAPLSPPRLYCPARSPHSPLNASSRRRIPAGRRETAPRLPWLELRG